MRGNEPRRWLEEGAPEAVRELLMSASADEPSEAQLRSLQSRLAHLFSGPKGGSSNGGDAPSSVEQPPVDPASLAKGAVKGATSGLLKGALAGTAAFLVAGGASFQAGRWYERGRLEAARAAGTVAAPPPSSPVALPAVAPAAEMQHVAAEMPPTRGDRPIEPRRGRTPSSEGGDEASLLERAMDELRMGRWEEAMRLLSLHASRFPKGALAQEREVLAIQALIQSGRREEARARAARFRQSWPTSPHWIRIESLLGSP